jgi:hypothetical protein
MVLNNFKNVLKNSKSNDEKYIACLRIHESFYKMNKEYEKKNQGCSLMNIFKILY